VDWTRSRRRWRRTGLSGPPAAPDMQPLLSKAARGLRALRGLAGGPRAGVRRVNLALQGGGAHGAFTWGVLDRLLEDERIAFDGISGTSAGAMNATVLASGLALGGRDGARRALAGFWRRVAEAAALGPLQPGPFDRLGVGGEHYWDGGYAGNPATFPLI